MIGSVPEWHADLACSMELANVANHDLNRNPPW
jgi:hypothetical protein